MHMSRCIVMVYCIYLETLYLVLLCILILNFRVVCVGGDGMFSELLNGLCERKLKEAGLEQTPEQNPIPPDLKIGVIPAGNVYNVIFIPCRMLPKVGVQHFLLLHAVYRTTL